MANQKPLLVFDTNILMDFWLERDSEVPPLIQLAKDQIIDIIVPEYVILEFRGAALRWYKEQKETIKTINKVTENEKREWQRAKKLSQWAISISQNIKEIDQSLDDLKKEIDVITSNIQSNSIIWPHTPEIHYRGDLRYLEGKPPDKPGRGINDCRIYETVLDIARHYTSNRKKFFVCKDSDFHSYTELLQELHGLGFEFSNKIAPLYYKLYKLPAILINQPDPAYVRERAYLRWQAKQNEDSLKGWLIAELEIKGE